MTITNGTLKVREDHHNNGWKNYCCRWQAGTDGHSCPNHSCGCAHCQLHKRPDRFKPCRGTLGGTVKLTGTLNFGNVNNSTITTGGNLILISNSAGTANVGDLTNGGTNSGNNDEWAGDS